MEDKNQNNNTPSKSGEEEIDLGQLFSLIGKGFSGLFRSFGKLFKYTFYGFVHFLLIVRRNFIFFTISSMLGLALGAVYQNFIYIPKYESSMTVKPNFGSTVQLYKNIDFYQNLVYLKDYEKLAENLNITESEAESIRKFSVEPYANKNQSIKAYGRFLADLDTMIVRDIPYEEFVDNQPVESFEYHVVSVKSKDRYVFKKLEPSIINSIEENDFYRKERTIAYNNMVNDIKSIRSSISALDTLREIRNEILIRESEKEVGSGTNIYMAAKDNGIEVSYYDYKTLNDDLSKANRKLMSIEKIITVVSNFDSIGKKEKKWFINFYILGFFVGFMLSFGYVNMKSANVKLKEIDERKNNK